MLTRGALPCSVESVCSCDLYAVLHQLRTNFKLFGNQLIVEMKHVRDANTMAAVSKTVLGLGSFCEKRPNVGLLLFAILVDKAV